METDVRLSITRAGKRETFFEDSGTTFEVEAEVHGRVGAFARFDDIEMRAIKADFREVLLDRLSRLMADELAHQIRRELERMLP